MRIKYEDIKQIEYDNFMEEYIRTISYLENLTDEKITDGTLIVRIEDITHPVWLGSNISGSTWLNSSNTSYSTNVSNFTYIY